MKYLFVSDVHLCSSASSDENNRIEKHFLDWLSMAEKENATIFLLGDIFDFWFEYKNIIPKGYSTVLGRLKEMVQDGTEIHFFKGNHDMWLQRYFQDEIGLIVHDKSEIITIGDEKILIGHGHDLCFKQSIPTRLLWLFFNSSILYTVFRMIIHPDLMIKMGQNWSRSNRKNKKHCHIFREDNFIAKQINERLDYYTSKGANKFIFGHFHTPTLYTLKDETSQLMILSEWGSAIRYGELENGNLNLKKF